MEINYQQIVVTILKIRQVVSACLEKIMNEVGDFISLLNRIQITSIEHNICIWSAQKILIFMNNKKSNIHNLGNISVRYIITVPLLIHPPLIYVGLRNFGLLMQINF